MSWQQAFVHVRVRERERRREQRGEAKASSDRRPPLITFLFFSFLLFQITATFKPSDDRYVINAAPRT